MNKWHHWNPAVDSALRNRPLFFTIKHLKIWNSPPMTYQARRHRQGTAHPNAGPRPGDRQTPLTAGRRRLPSLPSVEEPLPPASSLHPDSDRYRFRSIVPHRRRLSDHIGRSFTCNQPEATWIFISATPTYA